MAACVTEPLIDSSVSLWLNDHRKNAKLIALSKRTLNQRQHQLSFKTNNIITYILSSSTHVFIQYIPNVSSLKNTERWGMHMLLSQVAAVIDLNNP
jgi:hypothetical protein